MVSFILPGNSATGGYEVDNSLRFNDGDSANLSRTQVAGNRTTFTFSTWVKRSALGTDQMIFNAASPANSTDFRTLLRFGDADVLQFYNNDATGGGVNMNLKTNRLFRDVSAWYHIVLRFDTTQSTEANRIRLYVNGVQETSFSTATYPSQNADNTHFNYNGNTVKIGGSAYSDGDYFDGYMAEAVLCDGSSLAPTSFGEFDEDSPTIWKPIDVSDLTFGNNGFYLDFEDSSALGTDVSGEGHNYTANNLAATDQSIDTCTNNYATFNSIAPTTDITLSEGNLKGVYGTADNRTVQTSTFGLSSGKWYWEIKIGGSTSPNNAMVGITQLSTDTNTVLGTADNSWAYRGYDGKVYHNNGDEGGSLNTFTDGDIIGIALNLDNLQGSLHKLYFSKNGTFQNSADPTDFTSTTGVYGVDDNVDYFPAVSDAGSSATPQFEINFGSPSFSISSGNSDANGYGNFEYSVPSGFYAINSKNLAEFG